MKKLFLIASIDAALGASSVMASESSINVKNTLNVQEVHDSSLSNARDAKEAFKAVRGVYAMDDGTILSLYKNGNAFVAEVNGQAPIEVAAAKNGKFIAVNGTAEIKFVQNAGGQVASVVLTRLG